MDVWLLWHRMPNAGNVLIDIFQNADLAKQAALTRLNGRTIEWEELPQPPASSIFIGTISGDGRYDCFHITTMKIRS
jgi:hypothetical protein